MSTYVFIIIYIIAYTIDEVMQMYIPTLDAKKVGEVIAKNRRRKGISQEVLSGLADIGRTHLSAIERGERKPTLETLYRISCALNIKMSDIVKEIEKCIEENSGTDI